MKPASAIGALLSIGLLAGCGVGSHPMGKTARELQITLSSANGLYFSPHLLTERASISDIIAAVRTAGLVEQPATVHPTASVQQKLRQSALEVYGANAYGHLAYLYLSGARHVLRKADVQILEKRRRPDGSYTPGSTAPPGLISTVQSTRWALFAQHTLHGLSAAKEQRSINWLNHVATTNSDPTTVRLAMQAVRAIAPAKTPPYHGAVPDLSVINKLPPDRRRQLITDAASYVEAVGVPAARGTVNRTAVAGLYKANVGSSDFPMLRQLVILMRASGASNRDLSASAHRLTTNRLPDGLYRNASEYFGSSIATIYVMRLLRMRGESTKSPSIAKALMHYAAKPQVRGRPAEKLIALGASVVSGHEQSTDETRRLCRNPQVVATKVDQHNVIGWAELTRICAEAGTKSPVPRLTPWPAKTTEQTVAQATMVNALAATGREDLIPHWVRRKAMRQLLRSPAADVSLLQVATVGTAYLTLTGGDGRERLDNIRMRADKARGCPGLPDLYTSGEGDDSCDLRTTIAVENFLSA